MKTFLRDNPTIALGLGLPVLLVVTFLIISGLPALFVAPPQYDVLYASQFYNYQNGVQISVIDQKVQVFHQGTVQRNQKPRIWHYNAKTGSVKEISYLLPANLVTSGQNNPTTEQLAQTTLIDVPDLVGLTIDSSSIAPDGYEFNIGDHYSRNAFGSLFYSSRYASQAVLNKNGRSIRLPNASGNYYSRNTRFIGWVVSP